MKKMVLLIHNLLLRNKLERTVPVLVLSLLFVSYAWAVIGLGVDPPEIYLENVPLGKQVAVSKLGTEAMKLKIENKGEVTTTYEINVLSSLETKAPLREGFTDIAQTAWIWPENKEVSVAGKSTKVVELYMKIPKKKEYYNKKYQGVIEVKSKKNRPEEVFVLACQVRVNFSTSGSRPAPKFHPYFGQQNNK